MAYYNTCPNCGSHLDPGEKCDCQQERTAPEEVKQKDEDSGHYYSSQIRDELVERGLLPRRYKNTG